MEFGLQYESYIKMTDLLLNIVIQAHIFVNLLLLRLWYFIVLLSLILLIIGSVAVEWTVKVIWLNI